MSGDPSLKDPVIFYSEEMTDSKIVLLHHYGIKFTSYHYHLEEKEE